jgi:ribosomal protein L32
VQKERGKKSQENKTSSSKRRRRRTRKLRIILTYVEVFWR